MHDFIVNFIPHLQNLNSWGYLIVFLAAFIESLIIAGYFVPGSTIIIIFGMLAGGGYYYLGDVFFFSFLGNVLGNLISFYIGTKVGKKVLKQGFYFIKAKHFIKANNFFKIHGGKSVLFGKLIPGIKESIPFVAGILEMGIFKFSVYNILGGFFWSVIFVGLGYVFSSSLSLAETWATRFGYIILVLFLFFGFIYVIKYLFVRYGKSSVELLKQGIFFLFNKFLSIKNIKSFIKNNPKKVIFIKNRFNKNNFLGLPFTILSILFLYILIEYIGITDSILDGDMIVNIDIRLSEFFYYFKDKRLIDFFLGISYFGSTIIVILITIISSFILFLQNKKFEIVGLFISLGVVTIVSSISKIIIARARPELAVYKEIGYSFPSFHATISVALYGFILWLFLVNLKKWKNRINLIFIGIIIAFLIGFSRLYLNVHYLSDVIAGWFLGFLGLIFGITITGYLNHIYKKNNKQYFKIYNKIIILLIIFIGILFSFLNYGNYYNNIHFNNNLKEKYTDIFSIKKFFNNNKKLRFTETITGRLTEPINFIFIAKEDSNIIELFKNVGWNEADRLGRKSIKNIGRALFDNKKYKTAPITPLYWNKEIQTYGFQKLTKKNTIKLRHHIRIWKTDYKIGKFYVFVGCGIYDDGIKWGITHKISPNLDKEREYIFKNLKKSNLLKSEHIIQLENGFKGINFSGDLFFTDGKAYIIKL